MQTAERLSIHFPSDEICVVDFGALQSRLCRGRDETRTEECILDWSEYFGVLCIGEHVDSAAVRLILTILFKLSVLFLLFHQKPVDITIKI